MQPVDLAAVTAIEQAAYRHPWTRGIFSDCLRVGYCCRVVEAAGQIRAHAIVAQGVGEAHLLNLCVHPDHQRRGLATTLLDHLIREARLAGSRRMFLEVRPTNRPALALYRRHGFRVIGKRPGYYPGEDGREDALVMVCHLADE